MSGLTEHAGAVAAARDHVAASAGRPLRPLPAGFAEGRLTLHRVAEELLKPKRVLETGNEIALRFTPGGFGTDPWEHGAASGTPGDVRVEGTELVLGGSGEEQHLEIGDLGAAAELLGVDGAGLNQETAVSVDSATAAAVADWLAYGTVLLAALIERFPDREPEPIRLWPEHFDVATVLGSEEDGSRANFGASPGDDDHPEPYLYAGPWQKQPHSPVWNATAFPGAELNYADLLEADDQIEAGVEFLVRHFENLNG